MTNCGNTCHGLCHFHLLCHWAQKDTQLDTVARWAMKKVNWTAQSKTNYRGKQSDQRLGDAVLATLWSLNVIHYIYVQSIILYVRVTFLLPKDTQRLDTSEWPSDLYAHVHSLYFLFVCPQQSLLLVLCCSKYKWCVAFIVSGTGYFAHPCVSKDQIYPRNRTIYQLYSIRWSRHRQMSLP